MPGYWDWSRNTWRKEEPGALWVYTSGHKTLLTETQQLQPFRLDNDKPVYHDTTNQGAIHAPSLLHATTAAVLRNAYKSNDAAASVQNRLAVNLSSARVRTAMQLVEGIRNGQSLGALLGFRLERGLHEAYQKVELDKYIQPLRKAYPLQQQVQVSAGETGSSYVSQVINGEQLLKEVYAIVNWNSVSMTTAGSATLGELLKKQGAAKLPVALYQAVVRITPQNNAAIFDAIIDEIDKIADAFDAIGDLAISESVYQMVQGNHVRASSVMSALAEGRSLPDPQIIETPRTGTVVTQRLLLNIVAQPKGTIPPGWTGTESVKYLAEPSLNYWLGARLGPVTHYRYIVRITEAKNIVTEDSLTLVPLKWQPIDFYSLQGDEHELSNILLTIYQLDNPAVKGTVTIDIAKRGNDWAEEDKTLTDLALELTHLRRLLGNARFMGINDLQQPHEVTQEANPGAFAEAELKDRINGAYQTCKLFNGQVANTAFIADILNGKKSVEDTVLGETDFSTLLSFMKAALSIGVPQAMAWVYDRSEAPVSRYRSALQYVLNLYRQTREREVTATATLAKVNGDTLLVKDKIEQLVELGKVLLGNNFMILPVFHFEHPGIKSQLQLPADKKITRHGGPLVMENWLLQLGKVRKKIHELSRLLQLGDTYDHPVMALHPVQLPYTDNDYWLGIEYPAAYTPDGDRLSLVLLEEQLLQTTGTKTGLVLDEWIEIIPAKEETTGVAFHYNQPNATAPQSMMLVHSPQLGASWEWDDLITAIIDTVDLAKNRAVEPDHLENSMLSHVLPTIISEVVPPKEKAMDKGYGGKPAMDFSENVPVSK
jgi:hypothetical protein